MLLLGDCLADLPHPPHAAAQRLRHHLERATLLLFMAARRVPLS